MFFTSNLIFIAKLTVVLIFIFSCTKMNVKIFNQKPKNEHLIVLSICKKTNASHFNVKNHRVILKRKDGKNIELKHNKSLLDDGYYFCTNQKKNSLILD